MRIQWSLIKSLIFGVSFFILFFGLATVSQAAEKEEGMYFSILGVENYIEGDFNGTVTGGFENSTPQILVRIPEIESGRGFGILIGSYNDKLAGELYYTCSNHDTSFRFSDLNGNGLNDGGAEDVVYYKDGECQVIGANIKYYFVNLFKKNLRLCGQFGLFIPKISMEEGAYKQGVDDTADVTFTGYGADLGLGILIHLHPNLAISGAAVFRYIRINEATAFDQDRVPGKSTYGHGRSYSVGLNYYF